MEKFYYSFSKVNEWVLKIEAALGALCLGVLFVIMTVNAALRYLFQSGLNWSDELNGFLFVWFGFLAACYGMGRDTHLNISVLVDLLPRTVRFGLKQAINLLMLYFCVIYIGPLGQMISKLSISNVMRIPLKDVYVILPITFILMIFHIIFTLIKNTYVFLHSRSGKEA